MKWLLRNNINNNTCKMQASINEQTIGRTVMKFPSRFCCSINNSELDLAKFNSFRF